MSCNDELLLAELIRDRLPHLLGGPDPQTPSGQQEEHRDAGDEEKHILVELGVEI